MLELEDDVLVRQLSVDGGEGIGLVLHILLTLSTKEHLDRLASLTAERRLLANALTRIDQIVDDGLVHRGQSVAVGAHTVELVSTAVGLAEDGSLSNEHHGAALELLLELRGETGLNESEVLEELAGHEDDDGLLVASDLDLLDSGHLEGLEGLSKILALLGDFGNLVSDSDLEVVGLDSSGLGDEFHVLGKG